jgi:hypothetical protein
MAVGMASYCLTSSSAALTAGLLGVAEAPEPDDPELPALELPHAVAARATITPAPRAASR